MISVVAKNTVTPLLLRLMLATIFIFHGLDLVTGQGHQMGANWNPAMPAAAQLAVAWGQLLGGIALAHRLPHASGRLGNHRHHGRRHRHGSLAPRLQHAERGL